MKNILKVKANQVLQDTVTILNIYVHTLSFPLPTFFSCSSQLHLKKKKITPPERVMKQKVTELSHQQMLESLTGKHNTEYTFLDWHSFCSYCTSAWRNHTHLEEGNCIIQMDETKPRISQMTK